MTRPRTVVLRRQLRWTVALSLVLVAVASTAACGSDQAQVTASQSAITGGKGTTPALPAQPGRCIDFDFAAEAAVIADHAKSAESAGSTWLDGKFDQDSYGPVTYAMARAAASSTELRFALDQDGQRVGDVEVRRDSNGYYVFSSHTCRRTRSPATTR